MKAARFVLLGGCCVHLLLKPTAHASTSHQQKVCGRCFTAGVGETDLNGAGILRIIQQTDGTQVFSLQVSDAATHQPTQHLLNARPPVCVRDQNNKLEQCHIDQTLRSPKWNTSSEVEIIFILSSCFGSVFYFVTANRFLQPASTVRIKSLWLRADSCSPTVNHSPLDIWASGRAQRRWLTLYPASGKAFQIGTRSKRTMKDWDAVATSESLGVTCIHYDIGQRILDGG